MSDRSDYPDEELQGRGPGEVSGFDALGVLAIAFFLAAVGLITFLLTSAVAS